VWWTLRSSRLANHGLRLYPKHREIGGFHVTTGRRALGEKSRRQNGPRRAGPYAFQPKCSTFRGRKEETRLGSLGEVRMQTEALYS
jgi:hypothetical protein